jgi:hypothetical protein
MTSTGADLQAFARLIEARTPWLDQVVIIARTLGNSRID